MAIFDRMVFLEGDQVDAYKAKKAKEEEDREKAEEERHKRRYSGLDRDAHSKFVGNTRCKKVKFKDLDDETADKYYNQYESDELRANAASYVANRNRHDHNSNFNTDFDAINKDMRRHPDRWKKEHDSDSIYTKRESTIFESVKFLNE